KIPACCDDEDDYNSAITPNEPVDSLSMGDKHLNTILATKSDEFIKSCVENLVLNPSKSEGENGCDVPACFTTFLNILFDADYESDSSDYQIYAHDSSIIPSSSKIDSLLDEFAGELTLLKSIPSGIDKTDCHPENEIRPTERFLYDNSSPRPPKEFVSENSDADIESFSPSPIPNEDIYTHMEEIDLTFTPDDPMPPGIKEDDDDSERDIIIRKELPSNYSLSLPVIESFYFDIPSFSRPPTKPLDGNTGILNIKMMGDISDQKVPMPRHMITIASNQEKSPDLLSHRGLKNFKLSAKRPIMIHGKNISTLDVPLTPLINSKSDEFIKSSVENLVPIPSESEDFFDIESECDMLDCDDPQTTIFSTFSNPFFDDSTSSDDDDHNEDLDSTPKNDRFDTKSYLLESLLNRDESIPPGIDSNNSDSKGDILSLERLLHDDHIPLSDTLDFDFSIVVRVFLPFFTYPVTSAILFSSGNEDTIFDPGIAINHFYSFKPGLSHRCGTFKKFNTHRRHLNESLMEMLFSTCSPMDQ
nr:hypothetical protein [Tanacetum cinerariifolium]